ISTLNYTLLLLMSMKNTPLAKLTGHSYERLNVFHRWIAVIAWTEGSVHTIAISLGTSRLIPDQSSTLTNHENSLGILALAVWSIILLSFPIFKKIAYEWFYVLHVAFFPVVTVSLFLHNKHCREPVAVGVALYFLDRFIRTDRYIWHNKNAKTFKASLQITEDGATLVTVPRNSMTWRPGSHAFLNIPKLRYFQSHPFTIASVGQKTSTTNSITNVQFLIKPKKGFTQALKDEAKNSKMHHRKSFSHKVTAFIDGPYGAVPNFESFDRTILIAAGSGITFILPIALSLIRSGRFRSIDFVWAVRNMKAIEAFRCQLEEITSYAHLGEEGSRVNVKIQITGKITVPKIGSHKRVLSLVRPQTASLVSPSYDLYGSALSLPIDEKPNPKRALSKTLPIYASPVPNEMFYRSTSMNSMDSMVLAESNNQIVTNLRPSASDIINNSHHLMNLQFTAPKIDVLPLLPPRTPPLGNPDGYMLRKSHVGTNYPLEFTSSLMEQMPKRSPETHPSSIEDFNTIEKAFVDNIDFSRRLVTVSETKLQATRPKHDALSQFYFYGRPDIAGIISNTVKSSSRKETIAVGACGVRVMTAEVRMVVADNMDVHGPSMSLFCEEFGW
ncbi:MAG: hypothetical protein M1829_001319, partial [Trizodia sp. TS-e1964]